MPTKTWVVGEEVLAADFNLFVQKQIVATFPNASARDAAIPTPNDGMVCYVTGTGLMLYQAAAWHPSFPGGLLWNSWLTVDSGDYAGGANAIPGLGGTVTVPAGRRLRVTAQVFTTHHTGGATHEYLQIQEGATQIAYAAVRTEAAASRMFLTATAIITPAAGQHTYQAFVGTEVGVSRLTGNNTNKPCWLTIEDVGAAF